MSHEEFLKQLGEKVNISYLAEQHAKYIQGLLMRELNNKIELYKEAFIHGFKHGKDTAHNTRFKKERVLDKK